MSEDHAKGDIKHESMNLDPVMDNTHESVIIEQNDDDKEEDGEQETKTQDGSTSLENKACAASPEPQPAILVAVDMTGSVRSPQSSKKKKSSKQEEGESLCLLRYRCSNFVVDDEEETSEMGFSRQSQDNYSSDGSTVSAELMVQQIYDQRSKLSAGAQRPTVSSANDMHQGATGRPAHQVFSSGEKPPSLQSSPSSRIEPGAYSIQVSGMAGARDGEGDSDSDLDGNDDYESSTMQLEAIPVDETLEEAKMKEMEEQMNREIARRLSLERKMEMKEYKHHRGRSCLKEWIPIIMALLIIISGISIGLYFLLVPSSIVAAEDESSINFIYPPPTTEECEAVRNGSPVPNQEHYPSVIMESIIDVSFDAKLADSVDLPLSELEETFQYVVVPTLIGCNDLGQEFFNRSISEYRYIIANLETLNVKRSSSDCEAGEPRPCVRAVVHYVLWTKAELPVLDLISFMQTNFRPALFQIASNNSNVIQQAAMVSISISPLSSGDSLLSKNPKDDELDFWYPPPTNEECEAVINGFDVANQDHYSTMKVDATMDISTYDEWEDSIDVVLLEMQDKMEHSVLPTLIGCSTSSQEVFNTTSYRNTRYILANADIVQMTKSALDCNPGEPQPCIRVAVRFLLWLKAEVEFLDLVQVIHTEFRQSLMKSLIQSDIIQQVVLASIGAAPDEDSSSPNFDFGINADFEFPPPTVERCEALFNGSAVADQDSYFTMFADAVLDVSTHVPWEDSLGQVLLEMGNQFRTFVIPTLAGCFDTEEILWNSTFTADRYILVNSVVLNVTKSALDACSAKEPRPCVQTVVHLQIWLMKEVGILDIIADVDQNYGPALFAKIGSKTDTDSIIKQAALVFLRPPVGG